MFRHTRHSNAVFQVTFQNIRCALWTLFVLFFFSERLRSLLRHSQERTGKIDRLFVTRFAQLKGMYGE